jgi:hypothetical protein
MKSFDHSERQVDYIKQYFGDPVDGVCSCSHSLSCAAKYVGIEDACGGYKVIVRGEEECPCELHYNQVIIKKAVRIENYLD